MKTFQEFVENITREDVDLIDKLSNMCDCEITEDLMNFIHKNPDLYSKIEDFVIEHVNEYEEFITIETEGLYEQELIEDEDDYSSGLYNCDEIYIRAILNTLGIMWLPDRL